MVVFYNDYVTCSKNATLSDVAGNRDISPVHVLMFQQWEKYLGKRAKAGEGLLLHVIYNQNSITRPPTKLPAHFIGQLSESRKYC